MGCAVSRWKRTMVDRAVQAAGSETTFDQLVRAITPAPARLSGAVRETSRRNSSDCRTPGHGPDQCAIK
jgi:hypothetical protein